jgi:hypothetical protein
MRQYAVIHLTLKSPDDGKEMLRQWSNSLSLLRNGELAGKIEGVMMTECKEGLSTRDCPRNQVCVSRGSACFRCRIFRPLSPFIERFF